MSFPCKVNSRLKPLLQFVVAGPRLGSGFSREYLPSYAVVNVRRDFHNDSSSFKYACIRNVVLRQAQGDGSIRLS